MGEKFGLVLRDDLTPNSLLRNNITLTSLAALAICL